MSRSGAFQSRRRRRLVVLAAAALVVAVGTACAFGVRAIVLDKGSTGLPPEGATPSTPETGELVISYDGRPELSGFPARFVPVNQVWVYADGRVIWRREGGPFGVGEIGIGEVRTGFLEQRLTPEGVELLQSELISTGLFDRDRYLRNAHGLAWGTMKVRNGDRLVSVLWCCFPVAPSPWYQDRATVPTPKQARALSRLTELLSDPASWLPASAWDDREIRAYVPSRYAICFWGDWEPPVYDVRSLEPSRVLSLLPAAAKDLLRNKGTMYEPFKDPFNGSSGTPTVCSKVTTDETRELDGILSQAGFERDPLPPGSPRDTYVNWRFQGPDPIDTVVSFEPILPHGQWEAMGG